MKSSDLNDVKKKLKKVLDSDEEKMQKATRCDARKANKPSESDKK